jgi:hypothetical protein
MKTEINQWLRQRAQPVGGLACGVRFPDKTSLTQSWSSDFPNRALENAWRCASDAFQVLKINFFSHDYVRWVYENAFLYCTRREDGICLGIFTAKDPRAFNADEIERLLAEFRALGNETLK